MEQVLQWMQFLIRSPSIGHLRSGSGPPSALRERAAVLKHGNLYIRTQTDQLVGRKNAAGTCADDNGIVMIHIDPLFIL